MEALDCAIRRNYYTLYLVLLRRLLRIASECYTSLHRTSLCFTLTHVLSFRSLRLPGSLVENWPISAPAYSD
jgi:hypothetical protein